MFVLKKILIIPSRRVTMFEESWFMRTARMVENIVRPRPRSYDAELQFYSDMPKVLGRDNVFMLGRYRPHLLSLNIPSHCPYPSNHGVPEVTPIKTQELEETIRNVDAVLISVKTDERYALAIKYARQHHVPIAMIDFTDHETLYGQPDEIKHKEMFRGFVQGKDFDIFFKRELFRGFASNTVFPLSPLPVRPESYHFPEMFQDKTIFYSGRPRPLQCQADRIETLALVRKHFEDTFIVEHDSQKTFMSIEEYYAALARSKMALSPSGRSWDSFRHCEVGLAPGTVLIAPKPYIEVTGPPLKDGVNAILYDTELRKDGKYHLIRENELLEKIRYYLTKPEKCRAMALAWKADVERGHTIFARSKYMIETMEHAFR